MQRFLESVNWYWKETWKLKGKLTSSWLLFSDSSSHSSFSSPISFVDYKDIKDDRESSIDILFGKDKEAPSVRPYPMINWKSSIDIMYSRNSSHLFEPHVSISQLSSYASSPPPLVSLICLIFIFPLQGSFVASLSVPKYAAVRANYIYEYPEDNSHEVLFILDISTLQITFLLLYLSSLCRRLFQVEIKYSCLEHWILKMKLPLNQSPERTFKFSAISRWDAFSFSFEITMKDSEKYKVANWSVGLTREAPTFSFLFKISQLKVGKKIESSATASYKVKSPHLSASTSW